MVGTPADAAVAAVVGTVGPLITSSLSKNGFLLLLGDVKGFDRPIVANFWPLLLLSSVPVARLLLAFVVWVVDAAVLMNGFVNGFVVDDLMPLPCVPKLSENNVSFCTPASSFWEKWVTLTGNWDGGDRPVPGVLTMPPPAVNKL